MKRALMMVVVLAVFAAGCGGSDDPTTDELIRDADAAIADLDAKRERVRLLEDYRTERACVAAGEDAAACGDAFGD